MEIYDPLTVPDPDLWLVLDEQERLALVEEHNDSAGKELDKPTLHAVMHTVVENQLALRDERGPAGVLRLLLQEISLVDGLVITSPGSLAIIVLGLNVSFCAHGLGPNEHHAVQPVELPVHHPLYVSTLDAVVDEDSSTFLGL